MARLVTQQEFIHHAINRQNDVMKPSDVSSRNVAILKLSSYTAANKLVHPHSRERDGRTIKQATGSNSKINTQTRTFITALVPRNSLRRQHFEPLLGFSNYCTVLVVRESVCDASRQVARSLMRIVITPMSLLRHDNSLPKILHFDSRLSF